MLRITLLKLLQSNTLIIVSTVISFIIGLLLSTIIEQLLSSQVNLIDRIIQGSVLIILILILIFTSFQFNEIKNIIRRQKLSIIVSYASRKAQDRQLYGPVNEIIASAKRSIRVVGMFRPHELQHKEGRKGYYEILHEAINIKTQLNQPFIYERIIQVERVTNGILNYKQTDPVTFNHCKQILDWEKQRSAVSVYVKQIPNILGALSFLIVDNDRFVMVIPDTTRDENGQMKLEGLQLGLVFEDADGILTEPMKSFFARLFNEADTVVKLEEQP